MKLNEVRYFVPSSVHGIINFWHRLKVAFNSILSNPLASKSSGSYLTFALNPLILFVNYLFFNFYRGAYAAIVCPSVRLSHAGKRRYCMQQLNVGSRTIAQGLFRSQRSRRKSSGVTPTGTPNEGGVGYNRRFSTNISLYLRNGAR